MIKKKSDYIDGIDEGKKINWDTRKRSKYEAVRKIVDLLFLWSDEVYDKENDIYYRIMKNQLTIALNGISAFKADRFTLDIKRPEDEWDDEWEVSINFKGKYVNGQIQYNYLSFSGYMHDDLSIDGLIYTSNIDSLLGVKIHLLTSVNL